MASSVVGISVGDFVTANDLFEWPAGHVWEVVGDMPNDPDTRYWITDKYVVYSYMEAGEGWKKVAEVRTTEEQNQLEQESLDFANSHMVVEKPRNKYMREIAPGVWVDVYDVLYAFVVTDPCLQHLIKKALATGIRGHKSTREDLIDIRDSAIRAVEHYDAMNKD